MFDKFNSKSLKTLIVTSRTELSLVIKDNLDKRDLGVCEICEDLKKAREMMLKTQYDWVITEVFPEADLNALKFLKENSEDSRHANTMVSLMIDRNEVYLLKAAFSFGLLSFFTKSEDAHSIEESIEELITVAKNADDMPTLVAANYLRPILREQMDKEVWFNFERELLKIFPSNNELFLYFAEAQFNTNRKLESWQTLKQLTAIDPSLNERSEAMIKGYFKEVEIKEFSTNANDSNLLGIDFVCVIEPDESVARQIEQSFSILGVSKIEHFKDGESAWKAITANKDIKPGIIIMEWRLGELTGAAFLQRLKFEAHLDTPVIVNSTVLKSADQVLVKELGVSQIVEKPASSEVLTKSIISSIHQDRHPSSEIEIEIQFDTASITKDVEKMKSLLSKYQAKSSGKEYMIHKMKAHIDFAENRIESAKENVIEAIRLSEDSITLLNLLGKCFLKEGEYSAAIHCFEKADSLSPGNVDRICALAESYSGNGEIDIAEVKLDDAKEIDADNKIVKEAECKVAFDKGDTSEVKKMMAEIHPMDNLISFMNNKAVALVKNDKFNESVVEYQKAIDSIPDERQYIKAIVMYNLALGYAKDGDFEESQSLLDQAISFGSSRIIEKAKSLKAKLVKAIEDGDEISITSQLKKQGQKSRKKIEMAKTSTMFQLKKGDLCCYKIFVDNERDEQTDRLLLGSDHKTKAAG